MEFKTIRLLQLFFYKIRLRECGHTVYEGMSFQNDHEPLRATAAFFSNLRVALPPINPPTFCLQALGRILISEKRGARQCNRIISSSIM